MSLKHALLELRAFPFVVQQSGFGAAMNWLEPTLFRDPKVVPLTIYGTPVNIRTATPDAWVALRSLGHEYDDLIEEVPNLEHNLIIDAGGYIGTAAIAFARAYPDAKIISLEPSPSNFAILQKNIAPYPNIIAIQAALGAEPGELTLRDRGTGPWGFTTVDNPEDNSGEEMVTIPCVTLGQLMDEHGAAGIDILKLDIEGGEYRLFASADEWMPRTNAVCAELHDRIVSGCTQRYNEATAGRRNSELPGDKCLSLKPA